MELTRRHPGRLASPRIAPLEPADAHGAAAKALASPVGHMTIFGLLAHAETNVLPVMRLGAAILTEQKLDARSRELMLLAVMAIESGRYEWVQHVEIALGVGITPDEIAAIARRDFVSLFSQRDATLLTFAENLVHCPRVPKELFDKVVANLDEREIVEAIIAVGFYMMLLRLTESLDVDAEATEGSKVMASLGRLPIS